MTDDFTARVVKYSSVVGSSVMVLRGDGSCVAMVSIRGAVEALPKETAESLAALIAAAINQ